MGDVQSKIQQIERKEQDNSKRKLFKARVPSN